MVLNSCSLKIDTLTLVIDISLRPLFFIHRVDAKATAFREETLVPLFLVPSLLNRSSDSLAKLAKS